MDVFPQEWSVARRWRSAAGRVGVRARLRMVVGFALSGRGAVAIEFAFIFPVLLVILLGIVEFSRAFWIQNTIEYAVEEAARFAIVNDKNPDYVSNNDFDTAIQAFARQNVAGMDPNDPSLTFGATFNPDPGTRLVVIVTASYALNLLVPFLPVGPINLGARTQIALVKQ